MSPGVPGGMGAEQFDRRITNLIIAFAFYSYYKTTPFFLLTI